jgi:hypothetical protein
VHGDIHPATYPDPDPDYSDPDPDNQPDGANVPDAHTESLHPPQLPNTHTESLHAPEITDTHAESLHPAELPIANLDSVCYSEVLCHPKSLRHPKCFHHCDDHQPDGLPSAAAPRRPSRWADAEDLPGSDH